MRVLMVCTGNICRSTMAHQVLDEAVAAAGLSGAVRVDSAGVSDEEHGNPMDRRARRILADHGYGRGSDDVAPALEPAGAPTAPTVQAWTGTHLSTVQTKHRPDRHHHPCGPVRHPLGITVHDSVRRSAGVGPPGPDGHPAGHGRALTPVHSD